MDKTEFIKIAKAIKDLGFKVAIDGSETFMFVGNDESTIELSIQYMKDELLPNFKCKNASGISFDGIGTKDKNHPHISCVKDVTKETIGKALQGPSWAIGDERINPEKINNIVSIINDSLEESKFKFIGDTEL